MADSKKNPVIGTLSRSTTYLEIHNEENNTINSKEIKKLKELKPFWRKIFFWDYNGKKIRNSFVIIGASFILLTSLFLLSLPSIGIVPKTITVDKNIQSNGQQTLNTLDPIYYTSRNLSAMDTANFNIQTTNGISFAISNTSIDTLASATKKNTGTLTYSFNLSESITKTMPVFLIKGDSLSLHFNFSAMIGKNLHGYLTIYSQATDSDGIPLHTYYYYPILGRNNFLFTAPNSDTWNLYWASDAGQIHCDLLINYNFSSLDLTSNLLALNDNNSIQTSFTAPQNGLYYFIVYYNYSNSNSGTIISYSNSFHLSFKEANLIVQISPVLILIVFITAVIIIFSFIQKIAYKIKNKGTIQSKNSKEELMSTENLASHLFCTMCGTRNSKSDIFCSNCGSKIKSGIVITEKEGDTQATKCSNCGNLLGESFNYCDTCGIKKA